MLEIIIQFVRRMLMGKGKGILQIASKKQVDKFSKDLHKTFKKHGISDDAVKNPNDVKVIWNQITNRESQVLSTTLDDILKGPVTVTGPKGTRTWDLSKKKKGEVIDFPDRGIRSLLKSGEVKIGTAPKTTKETLKGKKEKNIFFF